MVGVYTTVTSSPVQEKNRKPKSDNMKFYKPGRVLIIVSDQHLANRFHETLGHAGLKVAIAPDGDSGLNIAQQQKPDAIILDADLLQGKEAEAQNYWLFKKHAVTNHIPIIILTGAARERAIGASEEPGLGDFALTKNMFVPFTLFETLRYMELV